MKGLTLIAALLLVCTGAALAQTPDWMTPSEETICDGETGAAFGLCNAYCEAMDCESASPQASDTACSRVRDRFMNITGRPLPCEACPPPPPGTTCPCVGAFEDFDLALSSPADSCVRTGTTAVKFTEFAYAAATCRENPPSGGACASAGPNGLLILSTTPEEGSACVQAILETCESNP